MIHLRIVVAFLLLLAVVAAIGRHEAPVDHRCVSGSAVETLQGLRCAG